MCFLVFFLRIRRPPRVTLFPATTRFRPILLYTSRACYNLVVVALAPEDRPSPFNYGWYNISDQVGPRPLATGPWPQAPGPRPLATGPWPQAPGPRPPHHTQVCLVTATDSLSVSSLSGFLPLSIFTSVFKPLVNPGVPDKHSSQCSLAAHPPPLPQTHTAQTHTAHSVFVCVCVRYCDYPKLVCCCFIFHGWLSEWVDLIVCASVCLPTFFTFLLLSK